MPLTRTFFTLRHSVAGALDSSFRYISLTDGTVRDVHTMILRSSQTMLGVGTPRHNRGAGSLPRPLLPSTAQNLSTGSPWGLRLTRAPARPGADLSPGTLASAPEGSTDGCPHRRAAAWAARAARDRSLSRLTLCVILLLEMVWHWTTNVALSRHVAAWRQGCPVRCRPWEKFS